MNEKEIYVWRPIETAPKDRKPILCRVLNEWTEHIDVGYWSPGLNEFVLNGRGNYKPTHWCPIPEFPENLGNPHKKVSNAQQKTIREWLKEVLTEEEYLHACLAKFYNNNECFVTRYNWHSIVEKPSEALFFGFVWDICPRFNRIFDKKYLKLKSEGR